MMKKIKILALAIAAVAGACTGQRDPDESTPAPARNVGSEDGGTSASADVDAATDGSTPLTKGYAFDLDENGVPDSDLAIVACKDAPARTCLAVTSRTLGDRTIPFFDGPLNSLVIAKIGSIGHHFAGPLQGIYVYFARNETPYPAHATIYVVDPNDRRVVAFAAAANPTAAYWNTYAGVLRGPAGKKYPFVLPGANYIQPSSGQTPSTLGCVFDPAAIASPDPTCFTGFRHVETMFSQSDLDGPGDATFTYRHNGGWLQDLDGDGWEDINIPYLWVTRTLSGRTGRLLATTSSDVAAGIAPQGFHSGRQYGTFKSFLGPSGRPSVLISGGMAVGAFSDYFCGVSRFTALFDSAAGAPGSRALRWSNYTSFSKSAFVSGTATANRPGDGVDGCIHYFGDGSIETGGVTVVVHNRYVADPGRANCQQEQFDDSAAGTPDQRYGPCALASILPTVGTWRVEVIGVDRGAGLTVYPSGYAWGSSEGVLPGHTLLLVEPVKASTRFDRAGGTYVPKPFQLVELLPPSGNLSWRWKVWGPLPIVGEPVLRFRDLYEGGVGNSWSGVRDLVTADVDVDGREDIKMKRPDGTTAWVGVAGTDTIVVK